MTFNGLSIFIHYCSCSTVVVGKLIVDNQLENGNAALLAILDWLLYSLSPHLVIWSVLLYIQDPLLCLAMLKLPFICVGIYKVATFTLLEQSALNRWTLWVTTWHCFFCWAVCLLKISKFNKGFQLFSVVNMSTLQGVPRSENVRWVELLGTAWSGHLSSVVEVLRLLRRTLR